MFDYIFVVADHRDKANYYLDQNELFVDIDGYCYFASKENYFLL